MKKCLKISLSILVLLFSISLIPYNSKAETSHLVINEVYYDAFGEPDGEWIEIYNPTLQTIDLANWRIAGSSGTDQVITDNSVAIDPFNFVLISKDTLTWTFWPTSSVVPKIVLGKPITPYGLNNNGDGIILKDPLGNEIDKMSYGTDSSLSNPPCLDVVKGHSLERVPKGGSEFVDQPTPTPGIGLPSKTTLSLRIVTEKSIEASWTQNQDLDFGKYLLCLSDNDCKTPIQSITDQTITAATIDGLTPGTQYKIKVRVVNSGEGFWDSNEEVVFTKMTYSKAIIVNELFPAPHEPFLSPETNDEYIELYNSSDEEVDLSGWRLEDTKGATKTFIIKPGTKIGPKSYLIFYKEETGITLNNDGDGVRLLWPDMMICFSSQEYPDADYNISWSRNVDNSWLFSTTATPGAVNIFTTKQDEIISMPVIPVEEAKKQEKNEWVKIEGVVTSPPGLFGKRVMYIEDSSGGIKIYFDKALWPELSLGDRVIIYGKISISAGEYQIKVYSSDDIIIFGHDPPPEPKKLTIVELGNFVGQLVRTSGRIVKISGSTVWIDDGTGELRLYFYSATGIKKLGLEKGDWVVVVGILSKTSAGLRLLPRSKNDLKIYKKAAESKSEPSIVNQVLGIEKAQAAGIDYRSPSIVREIESKRKINFYGLMVVIIGLFSLASLSIFARMYKK